MNTLRKWFGPTRQELWQQLCAEIGAKYHAGGFWGGDKVEVRHGEWTILLDTYAVSTGKTVMFFTRIRAPYVNPDQFRFTIYREHVFSDVCRLFGMQDLEVGHPEFDKAFIIQGTDEKKVRALFACPRIRELIMLQPSICLAVNDNEGWLGPSYPPGMDVLRYHVGGIVKEVERLKQLFELFAATLDELCRIGSAYEDAPQVKLS
jgi:hypothetical protein